MSDMEFKMVKVADLKQEDGAKELMATPEMKPYIEYMKALIGGTNRTPSVDEIRRLPLDKRYVWRIASALKWGFADFEDVSVGLDRLAMSQADLARVMDLVKFRHIQFCMFLDALVGTQEMERLMNQGIALAKQRSG